MTNPANQLRELLLSWQVPQGQTIEGVRRAQGGVRRGALEFWDYVMTAVELLKEVRAAIDQAEQQGIDVEVYRKQLPAYYGAIFAPGASWNATQNAGSDAISAQAADMLVAIGHVTSTLPGSGELDDDRLARIVALLDEAEALIPTGNVGEAEIRLTIMIQNARQFAANLARFGTDAVVFMLSEVIAHGADYANQAAAGDPERSQAIKKILAQIAVQVAAGGAGKVIEALGGNVIDAIG